MKFNPLSDLYVLLLFLAIFTLLSFFYLPHIVRGAEAEIMWCATPTKVNVVNEVNVEKDTQEVDYLKKLYEKAPVMRKVAKCESGDRQFDANGNPLPGQLSADIGRFQINYVHWETAESMGIDLETTQGNAQYALYLYNKKGTQPWYMSKECWAN